jgi:hypothetical protein
MIGNDVAAGTYFTSLRPVVWDLGGMQRKFQMLELILELDFL